MDKIEKDRREEIVKNEYGGVLPYYEAIYIVSIIDAAERSLQAFARFSAIIIDQGSQRGAFSELVSALINAAAVSRFFFPVGGARSGVAQQRGEKLRLHFSVADTSILKDRSLRDAMEHYDEKLDNFLLREPVGPIVPGPIVNSSLLSREELGHVFQLVDPVRGVAIILGKSYNYLAIKAEILKVLYFAVQKDARGGRL